MIVGNYSRCDWYSATVNAPTDELLSCFLTHFDATSRELPDRSPHGERELKFQRNRDE